MIKIFHSPDDAIATAAARFGEETQAGGGVVFNVKWRRYLRGFYLNSFMHTFADILISHPSFIYRVNYITAKSQLARTIVFFTYFLFSDPQMLPP